MPARKSASPPSPLVARDVGSTPRRPPGDKKVCHSAGDAAQRYVGGGSVGAPDGGDWLAEDAVPSRPATPKGRLRRG